MAETETAAAYARFPMRPIKFFPHTRLVGATGATTKRSHSIGIMILA